VTEPGWVDVPSAPVLFADPSRWPSVRQIDEFVVSVDRFPEFGFLYYIVVWDVAPNAYRVRAYPARKITIEDWCKLRSAKPSVPEVDDSSQPLDSGWKNAQGKTTPAPF
jgi:hypothetical protein